MTASVTGDHTLQQAAKTPHARKDKAKVVDEVWDDARVASFLDKQPLGDEMNADFSALLYAYRSMRHADFERFVDLFVTAGRDLNARSNDGKTLTETIRGHRQGAPFVATLQQRQPGADTR